MDFITRNSKDLDELVGVVVDIFEKNTYIQKKDANSLWIIGEIQKQFMTSTRLYSDFMTIPKDERPAVFYDILFFILAHRSIRQLIPDAQQEEIQMIIDNKSNIKILFEMLVWSLDKNQDGILTTDEWKCWCFPWKRTFFKRS